MDEVQHALVDEHIGSLMREGASLRAERQNHQITDATDTDVGPPARAVRVSPARVRVGRWLIGVGNAIAGSAESRGGTAGRAA